MLARLHEEAQLLAELSDQAAAVTWLKDGHALPPGPKYEVQATDGKRALLVRDVVRDDAGLYECVSGGGRIAYQLLVQGDACCMCVTSTMVTATLYVPQIWAGPRGSGQWEPLFSVPIVGWGVGWTRALVTLWGGWGRGGSAQYGEGLPKSRWHSRGWQSVPQPVLPLKGTLVWVRPPGPKRLHVLPTWVCVWPGLCWLP